ncbi:efflux RND transporter permease subunit [Sulfuriroseicoccus oceanibius]|uniref:Efflux RND transporter permease subunit n=1 Tax=Sulfuriroseicoccus oceanibius TaxID=2707525 RepID=A0A6B3L0K6_9BACT|nr:efflux RND transporter permease subunit [Sulfuriroseicoccus oceanibius]QQL43909.1 efflux RND transporter permease subunit [Sulfuriroseicoccus oceanibius]
MEKTIRWFSKNHVAANLLMVIVLIAGFSTWFTLRKEIFPETSVDIVLVTVPYPNATPEEVENGVVVPIEEAIADIQGIKEINSTAAQSQAAIRIEVANGYKVREVMADVKSRVDSVQNLAEEAEEPIIDELLLKTQVLSIAVSANSSEKVLRRIAEEVREDLLVHEAFQPEGAGDQVSRAMRGEPTITQVELAAVRPHEISIEVSEVALRRYGLSLGQVADAVGRSSLDLPGGSVRTEGGEVLIRAVGKGYTADAFRAIEVVSLADGRRLTVGDIATVIDGFEDIDISSRFDGEQAIMINVFRVGEEDTLDLVRMVEDYLEQKRAELPPGVKLQIWNDQSVYLEGRLNLLAKNGLTGLILVFIALALFLRPSLAFLVALGIPVSFAGAIWMMPNFDVSINMISLFGFILVLGIVVDDAIVVGENVYTRMKRGEHPRTASWKGTHEVGVVVTFGVLTTMVAFTPMLGLSGVSGKIWPNIPLIVIPTLAFSLIQSKLVLPSHLALLKPSSPQRKVGPLGRLQHRISDGLERFVEAVYHPVLRRALHGRYVVLCLFVSVLALIGGALKGGWIKTTFFPDVEADVLNAQITMPSGTAFEETAAAIRKMEAAAAQLNDEFASELGGKVVKHILASAGVQPLPTGFPVGGPPTASNIGEVTLELLPAAERGAVTSDQLISRWRELTGPIAGAEELTFSTIGATSAPAIELEIAGDDLDELRAAAEYIKQELAGYSGVIDIADNNRLGKRELKLAELTPVGKGLGLTLQDVIFQMRGAFYGHEVQRLQRGRDEVKVMVRYPEDERRSLYNVRSMKIRTPSGAEVPYEEVVEPEFGRGWASIMRTDRRRAIKITADVDKQAEDANANEIVAKLEEQVLNGLQEKFPGVDWAFKGEQKDQRQSVKEIGTKFLFALLLMYVLMAIPLKSYLQPLVVMSAIPFGMVGAVVGHVLLGLELSIMSMVGIVALAGVVVNDSLVLVDYVNRHRSDGHGVREAAERSGVARFRAVLLTSLTTFLGLTPMLLETDIQARFLIPMAVSLGFGILFATVITLFLVPSIYLIIEDLKGLVMKKEWIEAWERREAELHAED